MPILETSLWSETPELLDRYFAQIKASNGIIRLFAYASLIDRHDAVKPQKSKTLPNEHARLPDMVVSMNLRTEKLFAGLEKAVGECAEGVNITVDWDDREEALTAYIKRELGDPPWGASIKDVLRNNNNAFRQIRQSSFDILNKYQLCIVDVQIPAFTGTKTVPALAVVTNSSLSTSEVGATPERMADLLLEDPQSLNYFYTDALFPARRCGMKQTRLEAIEAILQRTSRKLEH